jgi:hypothetical protein
VNSYNGAELDDGLLSGILALGDGICFRSNFLWQSEQAVVHLRVRAPVSLGGPSADVSYEIKQHNNLYREGGDGFHWDPFDILFIS